MTHLNITTDDDGREHAVCLSCIVTKLVEARKRINMRQESSAHSPKKMRTKFGPERFDYTMVQGAKVTEALTEVAHLADAGRAETGWKGWREDQERLNSLLRLLQGYWNGGK